MYFFFFFFNDTATTEIYTLSLHDALPICGRLDATATRQCRSGTRGDSAPRAESQRRQLAVRRDRKSTRLNSSHVRISYAVFCLKKKKNNGQIRTAVLSMLTVKFISYTCMP